VNDQLKPYPAYKGSGVPWLGEVPDHWELRQLGRFGRLSKGSGGTKEDETPDGVPCIRYGDIYTQYQFFIPQSRSYISAERASDYTSIQYGDILFAASGETIEEIGKSAVNLIESRACCGGDVIIFRPSIELNARFMGYAADCRQAAFQKSCMGRGITVMHLYGDQLKYMWVALPPLPEQDSIVRFLDHADRRIAQYIQSKRRLIGVLNEQKRAIVRRAVTRGLHAGVRLNSSGVSWLGEKPEHWTVSRLKFVASHVVDCLHATPQYDSDGAYPAIRTADVEPGRLKVDTAKRVSEEQYLLWSSRLAPQEDDIVYTREGERFGLAALVPSGTRLCISQRMMVFRIREDHSSKFFMWQLNAPHVYAQASQDVLGATAPHVNVDTIRNYSLLVPPLHEQRAIADYISAQMEPIDASIQTTNQEINLIRGWRARLIADVVTGKLDVRDAAAKLPDKPEEPVAPDVAEVLVEGAEAEDEALEGVQVEAGA
jgi:type I restriction enzyme S subunit